MNVAVGEPFDPGGREVVLLEKSVLSWSPLNQRVGRTHVQIVWPVEVRNSLKAHLRELPSFRRA
jgi:hypothetical protein